MPRITIHHHPLTVTKAVHVQHREDTNSNNRRLGAVGDKIPSQAQTPSQLLSQSSGGSQKKKVRSPAIFGGCSQTCSGKENIPQLRRRYKLLAGGSVSSMRCGAHIATSLKGGSMQVRQILLHSQKCGCFLFITTY